MDEALEVVELAADAGLEGVISWILRLLGLLCIMAGVALWLTTDLLLVPAGLVVVGLVLVVAPSVLLFLAELS